jgi:hypothetical protein
MATRSLNDIRAKRPLSSDARKRVDDIKRAMQLEIALVELRELRGASQTEIADSLGTSLERRAHREGARCPALHP